MALSTGRFILSVVAIPCLLTSPYVQTADRSSDAHTSLEALADQVVAEGIKTVKGSVVGDDSAFDQARYLDSWDRGLAMQGQIGPIGALQVNQGFERFSGGRVPADSPTLHAAAVFTELLRERGVVIGGQPASGRAPDNADEVTKIESLPVSELVAEMLTESDNTTAEMLLRNIGKKASGEGTFAGGVAAVKAAAVEAGISMNGVNIADGSGLDRASRATCAALLGSLVHDGPDGTISRGLAKAGQSGTLSDRMNNSVAVGRVVAKTGTLSGVSALRAGFAR